MTLRSLVREMIDVATVVSSDAYSGKGEGRGGQTGRPGGGPQVADSRCTWDVMNDIQVYQDMK